MAIARKSKSELADALRTLRGGLSGIILLSAVINVLTLAGSIYLMLVYDRVLPGHSLPTLFALFLMVGVAYAFHGLFDVMRAQILSDVASSLDEQISDRVQMIEFQLALEHPNALERASPSRDLDRLRSFIASPGLPALIDLPWIVFFLLVLTLVHYWLGAVALTGIVILAALTWHAERVSNRHVATVSEAAGRRRKLADRQQRHAELISSLGMRRRLAHLWGQANHTFLEHQSRVTDTSTVLSGISRVLRMFLQSLVLTVGAILVIEGKATAGVIFASSILLGRALAPVDQTIAHWRHFVAARQSWGRLEAWFKQAPVHAVQRTDLPAPFQTLKVDRITLAPPGIQRPIVIDASFHAKAGQVIGIIGPSASGKSSLVRGVIGAWRPLRGSIRLDSAALDQWENDELGRHIGYLPQSVELFGGTIAENIARFEPGASSQAIIAAAQAAGVHELVLQLPQGYETEVGEDGINLSAGQRQRIALARALYRDPFLIVLDEPNSNLDPEGEAALAQAIVGVKSRRGIVLLVAHHGAILKAVDLLLVMRSGKSELFGPRDEVLSRLNPSRSLRMPAKANADDASVVTTSIKR